MAEEVDKERQRLSMGGAIPSSKHEAKDAV
jgi:hypothetical protein